MMTISEIMYSLLIKPLRMFFEFVFMTANKVIGNPGLSIIALSLAINFLVLPLYKRADAVQEEERDIEAKLHDGIAHIKKTFKGDERMMMLQTYYRQNDYRPTDVFKGSISLFLEIPFFIAAYQFLSHLWILQGVSFGVIKDLGAPDGLIQLGGLTINLLPILMTGINLISCAIFTKGFPLKTKVQLYSMAIFFLIFLYTSPAGLVFYWTLNNLFSLVKTIFYKLKNPKKVLAILFAVVGAVTAVYGLAFYGGSNYKHKLFVVVIGAACMLPLAIRLLAKKLPKEKIAGIKEAPNARMFWAGAIYLVALIGSVIPSVVIIAAPSEFVDVTNFVHPIWYIVSTICIAIGAFVIWMGVFYWLAGKEFRPVFDKLVMVMSVVATANFMFFGRHLGTLSSSLEFEDGLRFKASEKLINIFVIVVLAALVIYLTKKVPKICVSVVSVATVALLVMSGINYGIISMGVSGLDQYANEEMPQFNLSKNGKNVIVFMLDRGINSFVPYIMKEKPELKEVYSGFTFYPNTISFGPCTNFGTPALFGGYEYTPEELNKRDTEPMAVKHDEALSVMPVLFDKNGYDVTVIEPPYAGYTLIGDLSIYDDYPNIKAYHAKGKFVPKEIKDTITNNRKEDFFCYSIMKSLPIAVQNILYNNANYNKYPDPAVPGKQEKFTTSTARGIDYRFVENFSVLQNLPAITNITEDGDTFMMIDNEAPHYNLLLQTPEYTIEPNVDNTEYDKADPERFIIDGTKLHAKTRKRMSHYHVNMACLMEVGKWLQYLKDNGVYDNTRIIITSDHGRALGDLKELILDDGENWMLDTEFYYPILFFKDFGAQGELQFSDEFMTHADTPTLAVGGIIDNPVNPFTGKEINNNEKFAHDQYVLASHLHDIAYNNGTRFLPDMWLSVHDDRRKKENWKIVQENSDMPY